MDSGTPTRTVRSEIQPFDTRSPRKTWTPTSFGIADTPTYEPAKVGNGRNLATVSWLYRFFDAEKTLLYVGVTTSTVNRWPEHTGRSWWRLVRFASIEAVPPKDRLAYESAAIRHEQPLYNRTQKARPIITSVYLDQGPGALIKHLRDRMWPDDFAALVAAFKAEPGASAGSAE